VASRRAPLVRLTFINSSLHLDRVMARLEVTADPALQFVYLTVYSPYSLSLKAVSSTIATNSTRQLLRCVRHIHPSKKADETLSSTVEVQLPTLAAEMTDPVHELQREIFTWSELVIHSLLPSAVCHICAVTSVQVATTDWQPFIGPFLLLNVHNQYHFAPLPPTRAL